MGWHADVTWGDDVRAWYQFHGTKWVRRSIMSVRQGRFGFGTGIMLEGQKWLK